MSLSFHNAMLDPTPEEREALDEAYEQWQTAREGGSNDEEFEAAYELIDLLMDFASISYEEDQEEE